MMTATNGHLSNETAPDFTLRRGDSRSIALPLLADFWPHGAVAKQYGVFRDGDGVAQRSLFFIDAAGIIQSSWVSSEQSVAPGSISSSRSSSASREWHPNGRPVVLEPHLQKTVVSDRDWSLGPPQAPVTVLEYGDFECPACRQARPVLEGLLAAHPGAFRLVFRHFPLATLHPHAELAAEAAEAAGAQGKFWEMHDLLFLNQAHLALDDLRGYARSLVLDLARLELELTKGLHRAVVKQDSRRGIEDGVNGTPTIFINGVRYDGPRERRSILAAVAHMQRGNAVTTFNGAP